jgi:hypothetical protein
MGGSQTWNASNDGECNGEAYSLSPAVQKNGCPRFALLKCKQMGFNGAVFREALTLVVEFAE